MQGGRTGASLKRVGNTLAPLYRSSTHTLSCRSKSRSEETLYRLEHNSAASAALDGHLFLFGGNNSRQRFNTLHRLESRKLCWCQESPQNADGVPMAKTACEMIAFGNSLGVFGGYGGQRPTEP